MNVRKYKLRPFGMVIRTGGVGAVLARLFRTVMHDLGITEQDRYDALMVRYIQKARFLPDAEKQEALRLGLSKELLKESITWKTLMKGFEFLYITQVEFKVTLDRSGVQSEHSVSFLIGKREEPGRHLASLMARIFHELDIRDTEYDRLMVAYIEKSRDTIHKRQRASIRAAVSKELTKDTMTWKTFMKGLVFIGVERFTIDIKLHHQSKAPTKHRVLVAVDGIDEDGNED